MRDILFRAKRADNGAWETGGLVVVRGGCSDEQVYISEKMTGYHTPVLPETVWEFTGLLDKNGRKIFEGDIIRTTNPYTGEEYVGVVEWGCYYTFGVGFVIAWNSDDDDLNPSLFYWVNDVGVEVVGNCYDNPELLEGGKYNG